MSFLVVFCGLWMLVSTLLIRQLVHKLIDAGNALLREAVTARNETAQLKQENRDLRNELHAMRALARITVNR